MERQQELTNARGSGYKLYQTAPVNFEKGRLEGEEGEEEGRREGVEKEKKKEGNDGGERNQYQLVCTIGRDWKK